jgi:uncharacterized protein
MKRTIIWERVDFTGVEHLLFNDSGNVKTAAGHIIGVSENQPFAVNYRIEINADWKVSAFKIISLDVSARQIEMNSDGRGKWFDENSEHREEFDGCFEIDITLTPFTNTLPVKRLNLAAGERKEISVLYIELPEFNIKRVEQFYTKLDERLYVYEGYPKDFRARLPLDENDFVIDYPELFRRIYPKNQ